ncbi:MAG: DUF1501 domain-containing protein [Chthoniobacteraceae bacterium]
MHPSRRDFVRSFVAGSMLFPGLVSELLAESAAPSSVDPLAPKPTHFPPKAKRVIFVFATGGVSHIDAFDPKPKLFAGHGTEIKLDHPETNGRPEFARLFYKRPQWEFSPYGQCGTEVSSLFPHVGARMDDIALIRSMHTSNSNHFQATLGMHTGSFTFPRPSIGSWMSYGLGTENRDLPAFIVIAPHLPYAGTQVWASDFLPAAHQGMLVVPGPEPVANVQRRVATSRLQEIELAALGNLNAGHLAGRETDSVLAARMRSFETAFHMQMSVPNAFDLSGESDATLALYGLARGQTTGFGWQCLAARRLAERDVRFIELIDTGSSKNWDSHDDMLDHAPLAREMDKPLAGLLTDLKQRGMFDDTLVVWATEFGRTPFSKSAEAKGREHHSWAFSCWLAGAGVKPGIVFGETDEHGIRPVRDPVHVHDFHATILHLMGLDHERLTYRHSGRDYRLTDVAGKVVTGVLA